MSAKPTARAGVVRACPSWIADHAWYQNARRTMTATVSTAAPMAMSAQVVVSLLPERIGSAGAKATTIDPNRIHR